MTRNLPLIVAAAALVATYVGGALIAGATGVATLADAAGNGTKLSAPGFIIVLEALAVAALWRGRRGELVLAPLTLLSLAATAFDGDFGHASLSASQVAWQVLAAALAVVVFALAAKANLTRRPRRPAAA